MRLTYYGDTDLDGDVDDADAERQMANWKEFGLWTDGDFDYRGDIEESDYQLLMNNYGATDIVARPGNLSPLGRLHLLTLDYPRVYWDIREYPAIWDRLAEFEAMNLAPVPPRPIDPLARGVPEPGAVGVAVFGLAALRRERYTGRCLAA